MWLVDLRFSGLGAKISLEGGSRVHEPEGVCCVLVVYLLLMVDNGVAFGLLFLFLLLLLR